MSDPPESTVKVVTYPPIIESLEGCLSTIAQKAGHRPHGPENVGRIMAPPGTVVSEDGAALQGGDGFRERGPTIGSEPT